MRGPLDQCHIFMVGRHYFLMIFSEKITKKCPVGPEKSGSKGLDHAMYCLWQYILWYGLKMSKNFLLCYNLDNILIRLLKQISCKNSNRKWSKIIFNGPKLVFRRDHIRSRTPIEYMVIFWFKIILDYFRLEI